MSNHQYYHVHLDIVAGNINEYIIPECQDACKKLWEHNIFTHMCSDYSVGKEPEGRKEDDIWITLGKLSEENKKIFDELCEKDGEHYHKDGSIRISRNCENIAEELTKLADVFKMQDVIEEGEGCLSVFDYLALRQGIPGIEELREPVRAEYETDAEYELARTNWEKLAEKETPSETILDDRSLQECLEDEGLTYLYDEENGIIYLKPFYMAMHQRYLDFVAGKEPESLDDIIARETKAIVRDTGENVSVVDKISAMREQLATTGELETPEGFNPQVTGQSQDNNGIIENPEAEEISEEDLLRLEIENLRQENEQLREAHSLILDENTRLHEENIELQGMFLRVREFVTKRLAKIPFLGKKILKEMNEELGERELPKGRTNNSGESR